MSAGLSGHYAAEFMELLENLLREDLRFFPERGAARWYLLLFAAIVYTKGNERFLERRMCARTYLEMIKAVSQDPFEEIARLAGEGRRMVGYMCTYVPEELIYASGFLPVRLLGRAKKVSRADQYLQSYCCSHVRGFLEDFLEGRYSSLEGVLFAHSCDTMQAFYDIFRRNHPGLLVHNLNFPTRLDGEIPLRYALREYRRFQEVLEEYTGRPVSDEALSEAIELYNTTRRLLSELYALHADDPELFPSVVLLRSVLASMSMDKREFNPQLEGFLKERRGSGSRGVGNRKRLILVGSVNINEEVYELVDDCGGTIVDDDLCTGRRYFQGAVAHSTHEYVLRRYFERAQCPAKHRSLESRARYLREMVRQGRADGVLFLHLKFCDPHAFDYPYLREDLEQAGVRSHMIEVEQAQGASGQVQTKVQAFVEVL